MEARRVQAETSRMTVSHSFLEPAKPEPSKTDPPTTTTAHERPPMAAWTKLSTRALSQRLESLDWDQENTLSPRTQEIARIKVVTVVYGISKRAVIFPMFYVITS